ncbi:MAG: hypothetical protein OXE86_18690 [Alphaproteobacteria bacterium]|nr:hypothetical protein [Alphaproteobacteria bacterium]
MTANEADAKIGRAFSERRDLIKKIACLKGQLTTIGNAAVLLGNSPGYAEAETVMESASDVREDYAELRRSRSRLAELEKVLS